MIDIVPNMRIGIDNRKSVFPFCAMLANKCDRLDLSGHCLLAYHSLCLLQVCVCLSFFNAVLFHEVVGWHMMVSVGCAPPPSSSARYFGCYCAIYVSIRPAGCRLLIAERLG